MGVFVGFGVVIVIKLVLDGYSVIGCVCWMDKLKCFGEKFLEGYFYLF